MLETSARLLRLLSLLQTRRDWPGIDLSDRLGVTARTVRRDIERLRLLGYPVQARPGAGGGYRLGAGAVLPPLLLDDEEAVAVAVGLRSAAASGLAGIDETAVRALAKLEQVLPSRLRHRVQALSEAIVPVIGAGPTTPVEVLLAVAAAVRDTQRLRVDYRSHDGSNSRRVLEPHRVVLSGRRWYLVAWDVERADWRTFRLDRLTPHTPTGPRFTPRPAPDPDLAGYLNRGTTTNAYRYQSRVTLHAPAALAAEHITPSIGVITPLDEATCQVLSGGNSLDEIALWLGLLGHAFTVEEPAELREHLAAIGARLTHAATANPPDPTTATPSR